MPEQRGAWVAPPDGPDSGAGPTAVRLAAPTARPARTAARAPAPAKKSPRPVRPGTDLNLFNAWPRLEIAARGRGR
jgi:hypothetical protein